MGLETIKRSRITIQDKGNNLYLVKVDLTDRERYAKYGMSKETEFIAHSMEEARNVATVVLRKEGLEEFYYSHRGIFATERDTY